MSNDYVYRPVPFNFQDLEIKAGDYIAKVKIDALQIATEARNEIAKMRAEAQKELNYAKTESAKIKTQSDALELRLAEENTSLAARRKEVEEKAKKDGFDDGRKTGYDEGKKKGYEDGELQATTDYAEKVRREAEIQLQGKIETLLPALRTAVKHIETAQNTFLAHWEKSVISLASAMAQRAISRQMPEMIDVPLIMLREALELSVGSSQMKIRLNPDDYETLKPQIDILISELAGTAATEIVPDFNISSGGCIVETSQGKLDQRIESRLERISSELACV